MLFASHTLQNDNKSYLNIFFIFLYNLLFRYKSLDEQSFNWTNKNTKLVKKCKKWKLDFHFIHRISQLYKVELFRINKVLPSKIKS